MIETKEKLDLSALRKAIISLQESIHVVSHKDWFCVQSASVQNTLLAGVIQNFEFVYELSIKMIRRQLELEAASPEEIDQSDFRGVLRYAGERGLIEEVESWFNYRKMRNMTSHTYDHEKAQQVYNGTVLFIEDAKALLKKLEARNA
jgi:nucleotidyltransferase substrate binding protein (TIGR01987 family)